MRSKYLAAVALATTLSFSSAALADTYNFSFSGNGITTSGILTTSTTSTPGVDQIIDISGIFSDTNPGAVVSGAITGLYSPVSYVSDTLATPGVAFTSGGLSYDDTFYVAGDSPAVCYDLINGVPTLTYPFSGGVFDIFGVAFNVGTSGDVAELWSNGDLPPDGSTVYAAALASATGPLDNPNATSDTIPPGEYGSLTTSATPEPSSLILLGFGLLGIFALRSRWTDGLLSHRM